MAAHRHTVYESFLSHGSPHPAGLCTPTAPVKPEVIGVWVWQPGNAHGISNESNIYSIIQSRDPGLAPRFLGHITDNDTRIIGFLLQRVANAREAGPADLAKCKEALGRLHALGIVHTFLRRHTFLVCDDDDTVLLQGFGGSFKTIDENILKRELDSLEQVLAQTPSEFEEYNAAIWDACRRQGRGGYEEDQAKL